MFKLKRFIIIEFTVVFVYFLINILKNYSPFSEFVYNQCTLPISGPCADTNSGVQCALAACNNSLVLDLLNLILPLFVIIYLVTFIIYKVFKYFKKDNQSQS